MPLVTIYTSSKEQNNLLAPVLDELRSLTARELSCDSRKLNVNEISIQVITSSIRRSIADIEVVIIAHSYSERIKNQDTICLSLKKFIEKRCVLLTAYVWLQLSELGHSA